MDRYKINIILNIVLVILLAVFLGAGYIIVRHYTAGNRSEKGFDDVRSTAYIPAEYKTANPEQADDTARENLNQPFIDFNALSGSNPDISAWLMIPKTKIDYPVMITPSDEQYYLHRDFDKKYSPQGTLFFDTDGVLGIRHSLSLIYGHHMKDGSMFAGLMNYQDSKFEEKHPIMYLYTPKTNYKYEIVAVFKTDVAVDNENAFRYYYDLGFHDEAKFDDFKSEVKKTQLYDTGKDYNSEDMMLMLSTCEYSTAKGRLVVLAKCINSADY